MRHSVWWLIACSFGLGTIIDDLVVHRVQFGVDVALVVTCMLLISMLCYALYCRQIGQEKMLIENQLQYMSADVDGVTLVGQLARRCGVLQRQRGQMSAELAIQQNQLYESNELVKLMLDQVREATLLIDQHGVLIGMNQRAQFITGYRLGDVQGRSLDKFPLIESLSALYEKGWSQQIASTKHDFSAAQSAALTLSDGGKVRCQWTLEELTLSIHRYYLVRIYAEV